MVCWVFFGSSEEKKHANALGKFWHKGLNFSSHEDAPKMADQSFCVSHRPNGRHALSRKSRVIILLIVYLGEGAVAGFAKIVWWSENPTLGSWDTVKRFGLSVKSQSRVPESQVLKVTSCLRWFAWVIYFSWNPVVVRLKSPVSKTRTFGCFANRASRFFWICYRKITFSGSRLLMEW